MNAVGSVPVAFRDSLWNHREDGELHVVCRSWVRDNVVEGGCQQPGTVVSSGQRTLLLCRVVSRLSTVSCTVTVIPIIYYICIFQSLGALSCVLIFLNFSDVSRMFSFLLLYYYL